MSEFAVDLTAIVARPPFPPFTEETALMKVQAAEDAWNSRDPERIAMAYTLDSITMGTGFATMAMRCGNLQRTV